MSPIEAADDGSLENVEPPARIVLLKVRSVASVVAYSLIVAVVVWRAWATMRWSFQGDDWRLVPEALRMPFLRYVFREYHGHLLLGGFALMWLTMRAVPYSFAAAMTPLLLITALGGVLMWRFLRALFGESPLNLIPLAVYLLCPLSLRAASWWTAGWTLIPLQVFVVAALFATLRYVRAPSTRRLVAVGAVYAGALLFWEKAILIFPLAVLFALLFLGNGTGRERRKDVARKAWREWGVLTAITVPYLAGYLAVARLVDQHASLAQVFSLARITLASTVLPAYLGGPWSAPLPAAGKASVYVLHGVGSFGVLLAFTVLVAVSLLVRRQAWRAWLTVLAYLAGCVVLVAVGRLSIIGPQIGLDTRYFADSVPVFALALALAFRSPLDRAGDPAWASRVVVIDIGQQDAGGTVPPNDDPPARRRLTNRVPAQAVVALVVLAYAASALLTSYRIAGLADRYSERTWFANVRFALASHPSASIFDGYLPKDALPAVLDPVAARFSFALGPLAPDIGWDVASSRMLTFDQAGHLVPVTVLPSAIAPRGPVPACGYLVYSQPVPISLPRSLGSRTWAVQLRYLTNANSRGWVDIDGERTFVALTRGAHSIVLIQRGTVSTVAVWAGGAHLCVGSVVVGVIKPSGGPGTPAARGPSGGASPRPTG